MPTTPGNHNRKPTNPEDKLVRIILLLSAAVWFMVLQDHSHQKQAAELRNQQITVHP